MAAGRARPSSASAGVGASGRKSSLAVLGFFFFFFYAPTPHSGPSSQARPLTSNADEGGQSGDKQGDGAHGG